MTWNSEENLQRLRSCVNALKLPPPPPAADEGEIRIVFLLPFVPFVKITKGIFESISLNIEGFSF